MNPSVVVQHITQAIQKEVDTAVIGLSGGADSFLVMILSEIALGASNVYAFSMPYSNTDTTTFNFMSEKCAKHLGVHHKTLSIASGTDALTQTIAKGIKDSPSQLNHGNTRSRARMILLYGIAHHLNETLKNRVRVMGTGNLSEDFIGYDTKGGDALADIFPIGHLFKSEVYALLDYFRDQGKITDKMINRTPSAGLWEGQTDEKEIGYTYNDMEPAIRTLMKKRPPICSASLSEMENFVWQRHLKNKHKHEAPPVIPLKDKKGNWIWETPECRPASSQTTGD